MQLGLNQCIMIILGIFLIVVSGYMLKRLESIRSQSQ